MAATPAAPARAQAAARSGVIPPIARIGRSVERTTAAEGVRALRGHVRLLRLARKHGAEQQVVGLALREDFLPAMHRPTHDPRRRPQRPDARGGRTIRAKVHAVKAGGQRDVRAIVDHDSGSGAAGAQRQPGREGRQRAGVQVPLADLNQVRTTNGLVQPRLELEERRRVGARVRTQLPSIGDQADRREGDRTHRSIDRLAKMAAARSRTPVTAVISPTPEMAPRTKGFDSHAPRGAKRAAK